MIKYLQPQRIDLATYVHSSLAKMEEKMKIHGKIHDVSTNLGKNPLLTLLLHVFLSRNAISLKIGKMSKEMKKNF